MSVSQQGRPTDDEVKAALVVLDKFEYSFEGSIKRYPEPEEYTRAMKILRAYVDSVVGPAEFKVTEGVSSNYHYHLSLTTDRLGYSLCSANVMASNIKIENWKKPFGAHLAKRPTFCEVCDELYHRHK